MLRSTVHRNHRDAMPAPLAISTSKNKGGAETTGTENLREENAVPVRDFLDMFTVRVVSHIIRPQYT